MSTTEGGRKVSAAVASTGRAVASTSRAVGGALSHARGALSGWWSALTTPAPALTAAPDDLGDLDDPRDPDDLRDPDEAAEVAEDEVEPACDNRARDAAADPPDKLIQDDTITSISNIQVI